MGQTLTRLFAHGEIEKAVAIIGEIDELYPDAAYEIGPACGTRYVNHLSKRNQETMSVYSTGLNPAELFRVRHHDYA